MSKNAFAHVGHFSLLRAAWNVATMLALLLLPGAALLAGLPLGWLAPVTAYLAMVLVGCYVLGRVGASRLPILLWPFGLLVIAWTIVQSTRWTLRRGGVVWRGTLYPLAELRAQQRVKL